MDSGLCPLCVTFQNKGRSKRAFMLFYKPILGILGILIGVLCWLVGWPISILGWRAWCLCIWDGVFVTWNGAYGVVWQLLLTSQKNEVLRFIHLLRWINLQSLEKPRPECTRSVGGGASIASSQLCKLISFLASSINEANLYSFLKFPQTFGSDTSDPCN